MSWQNLRDIFLFFGGFAGVAVTSGAWLYGHDPNPSLLVMFGAMMGLPAFIRQDTKAGPPDQK